MNDIGVPPPDNYRRCCGQERTGLSEARTARALGYHAVLLSLASLKGCSEDELLEIPNRN